MKISFFALALLMSGCSLGSPIYTKINDDGAFLLTQKINKDILCVKDELNKLKTNMRCFYVSENFNNDKGRWKPASSVGAL